MSIATILIYIYLFFGLIATSFVLLASYNIFTKGYKANSAFFGILIVIGLFFVSFVSAIASIRSVGIQLNKTQNNITSPNTKPNGSPANPKPTTGGKFY